MNFLAPVALATLLAMPAHAALITYDFTADKYFRSGSDSLITLVDIADGFQTLSGTLTFNDTFVSNPTTNTALYAAPVFVFDQFSLAGTIPLEGTVVQNGPNFDQIYGTYTPPTDGVLRGLATFIIRNNNGTAFSSTTFPDTFNLTDFNIPNIFFLAFDSDIQAQTLERVDFTITSLTERPANVVPLPGGLPLVLTGLGALFLLRRKNT